MAALQAQQLIRACVAPGGVVITVVDARDVPCMPRADRGGPCRTHKTSSVRRLYPQNKETTVLVMLNTLGCKRVHMQHTGKRARKDYYWAGARQAVSAERDTTLGGGLPFGPQQPL